MPEMQGIFPGFAHVPKSLHFLIVLHNHSLFILYSTFEAETQECIL